MYNIICGFHKTCRALTILNWTWKTDYCNLCSFLFLCITKHQISNWSVGGFTCTCHITSIFGHQCLSAWFCSGTHLFSVTSAILHRYTRPFSVQHFSNWSLKAIFKIAFRGWGYLPIGEMGNLTGRGIFMLWWESVDEWFWPFKPFLELKNNIVKIPSLGVNVKFCRDNFFYWEVEICCFEICEGFLWILQTNWKHEKKNVKYKWNINLYINIA